MSNIEERLTFGVGIAGDGSKVLFLGITKATWETMQNGMSKDLDLSSIGVPIKMIVFGGEDHSAVMKVLNDAFGQAGVPIIDDRRRDFAIKPHVKP